LGHGGHCQQQGKQWNCQKYFHGSKLQKSPVTGEATGLLHWVSAELTAARCCVSQKP
jgi:hypothetical protein